jgi:hypothetical protein
MTVKIITGKPIAKRMIETGGMAVQKPGVGGGGFGVPGSGSIQNRKIHSMKISQSINHIR